MTSCSAKPARETLRANLRRQVVRMLADPRSDAFVENFAGQWLQLRKLGGVARDKDLFPGFDDTLREAMREETEQYFAYILRNNRSVLELLDSNYTFVNEALARHYGIDGRQGRGVSPGDPGGSAAGRRADAGQRAHADIEPQPDVAGETGPVDLATAPRDAAPAASARCPQAGREPAGRRCRLAARAHGAAPDQAGMRLVPSADGSPGLRPGELRCRGPMEDHGRRVPDRSLRRADRRTQVRGYPRAEAAPGVHRRQEIHEMPRREPVDLRPGRGLEAYDYCTVEEIRKQLAANDYRIHNIIFGIVESRAFQNRGVARWIVSAKCPSCIGES